MNKVFFTCRILFRNRATGSLEVYNGELAGDSFFSDMQSIEVAFSQAKTQIGSFATICTVLRADPDGRPFSFFLRDVSHEFPIWIPLAGAAIVPFDDPRTYDDVETEMRSRNLQSDFDRMNALPEEFAEHVFEETKKQPPCPTWLGLGRDPRIFEIGPRVQEPSQADDYQYWGTVVPMDHSTAHYDNGGKGWERRSNCCRILFSIGPGSHCEPKITRRLLNGWMPILTSVQDERSIRYEVTAFVTNETAAVTEDTIEGVDLDTAYTLGWGRNIDDSTAKEILKQWRNPEKPTTVCVIRVKATNVTNVPAYAWFKAPELFEHEFACTFENGLSFCKDYFQDAAFAASTLDGTPLPDPEISMLVYPGESHVFDMWIPHVALETSRAEALMTSDWNAHYEAAQAHWTALADSAAELSIPETAINERAKAGLMHLETVLFGPAGTTEPLLANCGIYTPIGTESLPFIQYMDSMGWHDKARQAVDYFLLYHQQDNGFISCFFDYQSETGPVLWAAGEHFRYTLDKEWLLSRAPYLRKSCDFLIDWCNKNKTDENRAKGCWGLASGKVADPPDFFHAFFLNAGNYAGLSRMAEAFETIDTDYAAYLKTQVIDYRTNLNIALEHAIAHAPVIPMGDGTWVPAVPAWPEHHGATVLFADGGTWHTHGCFAGRDTFVGSLWLVYAGACDPDSYAADVMLRYNQHPQTLHNAALSQPYYSRHDYAHLARGEVKLFLQAFYHQMAGLQDRETYTFWEHYFLMTPHKTHEESWFLMQIRWMLWHEPDTKTLSLFAATPRAWFAPGNAPAIHRAGSYFGQLDVTVETTAHSICCHWTTERPVPNLKIRLPHFSERKATNCTGGTYNSESETVLTSGSKGIICLTFNAN